MKRPLDGVITGECRVRQRSGFSWIQHPERNEKAGRGNEQVRSHATVVTAKPAAAGGTAGVLAIILHTHSAVLAASAAPWTVNYHRVPRREGRGARPHLLNPARVL